MSVIELDDVEKVYQMGNTEVRALRGSDLEIDEGEFIAVMGPSGSRKKYFDEYDGCFGCSDQRPCRGCR
ncbi:abc transporter ATP-binding protein [Candidatus Haloredivivus sp. G17]|nr:abc transporter ATP-binding protein [Candidatus Haloredivivus sp. G17]